MDSTPEPRGFDFPGTFEVTAFGPARPEFEAIVLAELSAAGVEPDPASVRQRASRGGNYIALAVTFRCADRAQHEQVYARLRGNPAIQWTL